MLFSLSLLLEDARACSRLESIFRAKTYRQMTSYACIQDGVQFVGPANRIYIRGKLPTKQTKSL